MKKLLLVLIATVSIHAENLAVIPFEVSSVSSQQRDIFHQKVEYEVYKLGQFKIVERAQVKKLLQEQSFQLTGVTDSVVSEIGKILGVRKIVFGTIGKLDTDIWFISSKMVDVQTGEVHSDFLDVKGSFSDVILSGSRLAVQRLFKMKPQNDPVPVITRTKSSVEVVKVVRQPKKWVKQFQVCGHCRGTGYENGKSGKVCSICGKIHQYRGPQTGNKTKYGKFIRIQVDAN